MPGQDISGLWSSPCHFESTELWSEQRIFSNPLLIWGSQKEKFRYYEKISSITRNGCAMQAHFLKNAMIISKEKTMGLSLKLTVFNIKYAILWNRERKYKGKFALFPVIESTVPLSKRTPLNYTITRQYPVFLEPSRTIKSFWIRILIALSTVLVDMLS